MQNFEYTTDVTTEDGSGSETIVFKLKPISKVPVAVYRRNRGDQEAQMWATLEWGLPSDQLEALDRMPMSEIEDLFQAWNEAETGDQDKPSLLPPPTKG